MTKLEKETIAAALSEYAEKHQKAADRAASKGEPDTERREHATASIAMGILTYWLKIIDEPCGAVKI